jgi:hypothetical protein
LFSEIQHGPKLYLDITNLTRYDYNPLKVRRACRSKAQARLAFEENALPYAKGRTFVNPYSAFKFYKQSTTF